VTERVIWHGAHPQLPTGYATVGRMFVPRLADHYGIDNVAISNLGGVQGFMSEWRGIKVYPGSPYEDFSQDVIRGHYEDHRADLVFTMCCAFPLNPVAWRDMRTVHITPVDTAEQMSQADYQVIIGSGGYPAAVTRHGEKLMRARGFDPLFLPHAVDTSIFKPPADRKALRKAAGVDHLFVVGLNAANHDPYRRSWNEMVGGFAEFHAKHPASLLAFHTIGYLPGGLNLVALVEEWGISEATLFSDQYQQMAGTVGQDALAAWYGTLDVELNCGNEGFGLPGLEAQACGTPVVAGGWAGSGELCGAGWKVKGQREWNNKHRTFWRMPFIKDIAAQLKNAYDTVAQESGRDLMRGKAREFALGWDVDRIWDEHWVPALKVLDG
jgi:glycosyltransferase involved in cell wall biosynthesis